MHLHAVMQAGFDRRQAREAAAQLVRTVPVEAKRKNEIIRVRLAVDHLALLVRREWMRVHDRLRSGMPLRRDPAGVALNIELASTLPFPSALTSVPAIVLAAVCATVLTTVAATVVVAVNNAARSVAPA
eukprot:4773489-Prymnesium_polylepis.3